MSGEDGILVVGSVALDDIETPQGRRPECLGGSATYFSTAASYYAPVRLVGVVGEDFPQSAVDELSRRGVALDGLERVPGRTFRWRGRYGADLADPQTLDTQLNVFEHFRPKIPDAWRHTPLVMLGNIHPALQLEVLSQIEAPALVACDTMNFWISGEREALLAVLARIDLLIINETEARLLSGERNIFKAADVVREMGPRILVVKRGAYGALLFHPDGTFFVPAVPLRDVVDPTGAGDTFAAGMMGWLARAGDYGFPTLKQAVLAGAVMASFTCEGYSMDRLRTLEQGDLSDRLRALRAFMHPD